MSIGNSWQLRWLLSDTSFDWNSSIKLNIHYNFLIYPYWLRLVKENQMIISWMETIILFFFFCGSECRTEIYWLCLKSGANNSEICVKVQGWGNPKHEYRLGNKWRIDTAEKDIEVQVDKMFSMNWQRMPKAQKANHINRSIASRAEKVILPLYSTFMRLHLQYYVQPWGVHPDIWSEDWNTSSTKTCWEGWGYSAYSREGPGTPLGSFQYLKKAYGKRWGGTLHWGV